MAEIVVEVKLPSSKAIAKLRELEKDIASELKVSVHAADLAVEKAMVERNCRKAENTVANAVKETTSPFVPARTGSLDASAYVQGNTIIYPGDYARFLYFGKVMVDPDTGSPFAAAGATKVVTDRDLVFNTTIHADATAYWARQSRAVNMKEWIKTARRSIARGGAHK